MGRPSNTSLYRDALRDLVADIRCAERDGLQAYSDKCRSELAALWAGRKAACIGRWGYPEVRP